MNEIADSQEKKIEIRRFIKDNGIIQFMRRLHPYSKPAINVVVGIFMGAI
jgi:hypothetical protein